MDIKTSKSILAKLLAQENLNVVHAKVQTAYFDTKSRTLTLPIWQDMSGDLYDLLCGHEVGHALETPEKGWHDAIVPDGDLKKIDHALKGYLNVLEDCRIEKKIKNRYPGLRVNFYRAYQGLHEKNFFEARGKDLTQYGLIDRINLHFKMGSFIAVPFSEQEKSVIQRVENLETWEQVEALARELLAQAKQELQDKQEQIKKKLKIKIGPGEMFDGEAGDDLDDINLDEFDEIEYEYDDEAFEQQRLSQAEQDILDKTVPYSETDRAFREREAALLDTTSRAYEYVTIPDINATPFIVGYKQVLKQFADPENGWRGDQREFLIPSLSQFKLKNEKYVNYLVKEFELKRNAQQQARAKLSKSGEIDVKKVFSYQYNEDIFRRFTSLPNGKNHGMIMFFDMSGSMTSQYSGAIEQMLVLVEFCRKVNIPFEVYGFTNDEMGVSAETYPNGYPWRLQQRQPYVMGEVHVRDALFKLRQYFSDDMRPAEYKAQLVNMAMLARCYNARQHRWNSINKSEEPLFVSRVPYYEHLNGTPLNPAVLCSIDIYEKFVRRTKAEIVNMAFMTDGESDAGVSYTSYVDHENARYNTSSPKDPDKVNLIFTHKSTRKSVQVDRADRRHTKSLVRLVSEITGANIVCFDIIDRGSRGVIANKMFKFRDWNQAEISAAIDQSVKTFKKDRLLVMQDQGFSEYYLIPGGNELSIDDDELEVEAGADKRTILKAFTSNQNDKKTNRILLNRFVKMIA